MKYITLYIYFLITCLTVTAQNGKIDVKVTDQQQKPVDGVFAQLLNSKDSAMVRYTVSGPDGLIEFANIKYGKYIVYISQAGYENYYSQVISLDSNNAHISLP
ncbi:MAG TPA: carboxypeptidase-like regulatory domain-containing protein, partial [Bacteroidia bacterium]|nr:carboxypeptidase-like regulatory domain-containing protein [Bacteroidia bacterium]